MNCPKCGFTLNDLDFACPNCGTIINDTSNIQTSQNNNQTNMTNTNNNTKNTSPINNVQSTELINNSLNINSNQNTIFSTNSSSNSVTSQNDSINGTHSIENQNLITPQMNNSNTTSPINNIQNVSSITDNTQEKNNKSKKIILVVLIIVFIGIAFIFRKKIFNGTLTLNKKEMLYDKITEKSLGSEKENNLQFGSKEKENSNGLYVIESTKENNYPIYFFRGNALETKNNIVFANFCWRIVRTTENGGIKIIYNGISKNNSCSELNSSNGIGESKFNDNMNDNTFVGYKYGNANQNNYENTHTNSFDSTIKKYLEEWYENNLTKYEKYIEDTTWCNNRQVKSGGYSNLETSYRGNDIKFNNLEISVDCNAKDSFSVNSNNTLKYPIGLITVDEAIYAGIPLDSLSSQSYLTNGYSYWTMTPFYYNYGTNAFITTIDTDVSHEVATKTAKVKPMIALNNIVTIKSGDGSFEKPYIVE